ncbi:MAG: hypothetical protein WEB00_07440 [Dehalococcoidia bacterium]
MTPTATVEPTTPEEGDDGLDDGTSGETTPDAGDGTEDKTTPDAVDGTSDTERSGDGTKDGNCPQDEADGTGSDSGTTSRTTA